MARLFHPGNEFTVTYSVESSGLDYQPYLVRHFSGDWGDVEPEDAEINNRAVAHSERGERGSFVTSRYNTPYGQLWIVTRIHDYTLVMSEIDMEVSE